MVRCYFQLDLPNLIVYYNSFELAKKCNSLLLCTRDFLFSLAFCELVSANFNPCLRVNKILCIQHTNFLLGRVQETHNLS